MDEEEGRSAHGVILFTEAALIDLASIDNATSAMWGEAQAERYLSFLAEVFSYLVVEPTLAPTVEQRPDLRIFTAKLTKRRGAHGHRIVFRECEGGIEIVRILHTAMYWPDLLN